MRWLRNTWLQLRRKFEEKHQWGQTSHCRGHREEHRSSADSEPDIADSIETALGGQESFAQGSATVQGFPETSRGDEPLHGIRPTAPGKDAVKTCGSSRAAEFTLLQTPGWRARSGELSLRRSHHLSHAKAQGMVSERRDSVCRKSKEKDSCSILFSWVAVKWNLWFVLPVFQEISYKHRKAFMKRAWACCSPLVIRLYGQVN